MPIDRIKEKAVVTKLLLILQDCIVQFVLGRMNVEQFCKRLDSVSDTLRSWQANQAVCKFSGLVIYDKKDTPRAP